MSDIGKITSFNARTQVIEYIDVKQISPLPTILEPNVFWGDKRFRLLCPVCGHFNVHHSGGEYIESPDYSEKTSVFINHFWCEMEHGFDFEIVDHKGETYIRIINVKNEEIDKT